ncbi:glucose-6-phosphate isomerase [Bordetella genomosp. 13]|uniref:Glucose-6-phosphate isomerase n=1 Tax=Bordetella genomosp. 13 TaxID=463040 RepID=A0A1W6ZA02_9BORD|nr:glucose-6-phosphate isomerase [Bordetella genomosp. 13]ARP93674.1 glucose-6-phosphate isomerase [Bordetella genomosp. 13]
MPTSLSTSPAWLDFTQAVRDAARDGSQLRILQAGGLQVDLTAQPQSAELDKAGAALLAQQGFDAARAGLFDGAHVNWTEDRPAWHTALRAAQPPAAVAETVVAERGRLRDFVERADADGAYRHVLHLGIGGSDWGPRLAIQALRHRGLKRDVRFASNVDTHDIASILPTLDPHQTLVIIASKSFTTTEPLANLAVALEWLRQAGVAEPMRQVAAITANVTAAREAGIADEHLFPFWDWVGGRYSLWSSISLPVALGLGCDAVEQLLAGAEAMDRHFRTAPLAENAPVQMALAGLASRNVLGYGSLAILPYDSRLGHLVPWAQQLEMESLGKVATADGTPVGVDTGPVVWGMTGTDCQHTFFQWLHQDATGAPVDFVVCQTPDHDHVQNHRILMANCLAQRAAMLGGKPFDEALQETLSACADPQQAAVLARHRVHPGGRPSTLIVLPRLDAHALGSLLALYEHKVFTQGVLWGINPFDQWGVEFGKKLAQRIVRELGDEGGGAEGWQDASTRHWIRMLSAPATGK